jgi:hypothetical protein
MMTRCDSMRKYQLLTSSYRCLSTLQDDVYQFCIGLQTLVRDVTTGTEREPLHSMMLQLVIFVKKIKNVFF